VKIASSLAVAALLAAAPSLSLAQVAAPSLVEEDLPAAAAPVTDREPEPQLPPQWEGAAPPIASKRPARGAAGPANAAATDRAPPAEGGAPPEGARSRGAATSTAPPPPTPLAEPTERRPPEGVVRPIEPVRSTFAELRGAWQVRRRALREQDAAAAEDARNRILSIQQELGIENLRAFASAEVRDSARALAAHLQVDAVAHAELAAKLAPGLPEAHLQLARARFAREPSRPAAALGDLRRAVAAAARDPWTARALAADLAVALAAGLLAAGAAAVAVMLVWRLPLFLHDFHDLPLVRAATPVQGALLALALLALPLALGLGPAGAIAAASAAAWLYLRRAERAVVTAVLLLVAAAPFAAGHAARAASFGGTIAEEVWEVEHDEGEAAVARLAARSEGGALPAPALAALGAHAKRRGDLDAAKRWYDRAIEAGGPSPEILVNLGNVHLLRGDPDAAKAAWLDAADRAGGSLETLAAAHYNLSKLYVRQAALEQAQEARRRASQVAPELMERRASEDDFRANRYLVDVPVPAAAYRALAAGDAAPAAVEAAVRARLAGALPEHLWPWAPLALVALLWFAAAVEPRLRASRRCEKCGRPACARCDGASGLLCGQCVNVYVKKGVVDAPDRAAKEREVRRHARSARFVARAAAVIGGGAGHVVRGEPVKGFLLLAVFFFAAFLAVFHRGLLPPPQPTPFAAAGRLAVAIPIGVLVYVAALRDLFRRTRG
jgi:tetratricopeptide (TPR) repeat protein